MGPVFLRSLSVALGPADHLVIRYAFVSLIFVVALAAAGGWRFARRDWPRLMFVSTIGMVGYNLGSAFGFERVSAGIGSLIIGTQPLLIAATGALLVRERLTPIALGGLATGFAGTALLVWKDLAVAGDSGQFLSGCAMIFLCGLAWAIYVVASKPLIRTYGAFPVTAMSLTLATLVMLPLLARPSTFETLAAMTPRLWVEMGYIVILSTIIATVTWNYGAARLPAAASGAFLYLVPIIGVAAGAAMLDEAITPGMILGGTLILAGVAIAQFGPRIGKARLEAAAE